MSAGCAVVSLGATAVLIWMNLAQIEINAEQRDEMKAQRNLLAAQIQRDQEPRVRILTPPPFEALAGSASMKWHAVNQGGRSDRVVVNNLILCCGPIAILAANTSLLRFAAFERVVKPFDSNTDTWLRLTLTKEQWGWLEPALESPSAPDDEPIRVWALARTRIDVPPLLPGDSKSEVIVETAFWWNPRYREWYELREPTTAALTSLAETAGLFDEKHLHEP